MTRSDPQTVREQWGTICPSCLTDDALDVTASVAVRLTRDGTDAHASADGAHCWDSASKASCAACGWTGTIKEAETATKQHPRKSRDRATYTPVEVEAALAAWEHMIEQQDTALYEPHFDRLGRAGMRPCAIQAGWIAEAVFLQMQADGYEFAECFDYEFVPAVLNRLDWDALTADNQLAGEPYWPDTQALLDDLIEALPDSFFKADPKADWIAQARRECIKQWQYPDLLTDHQDKTDAAFNEKIEPSEFVKNLGETYDLIPVTSWNA